MMAVEIKQMIRWDVSYLHDQMCVGDTMVMCSKCGSLGFGLKRGSIPTLYVAVCLGCGENTKITVQHIERADDG